jgi:beta-phosphoglucomutase-like phosphatase (HAD superfamily)
MVPPITLEDFDAVLFDLDGVLTSTRRVHAAAWKRTFDDFLAGWGARHSTRIARFDDHADYATYVDGKPRQAGVGAFLASRGIELPEGDPDASADEESVWGLGNRKQMIVRGRSRRLLCGVTADSERSGPRSVAGGADEVEPGSSREQRRPDTRNPDVSRLLSVMIGVQVDRLAVSSEA